MKIDKKAINYYSSFFDVSKELNQEQFYDFNMAIFKVMFFEEHIDNITFKDATLNILWKSIKHSLMSSIEGYCNKKSIPYDDVFTPLSNPLANPLANKNNEEEKEKEKEKEEEKGEEEVLTTSLRNKKTTIKKFKTPTIEEVQEYISHKNYNVNADTFFNFYESNGWMVGKNKMKSWKASVAVWNSKETTKQQTKSFNTPTMQQLNTDVNVWDAIEAQTERGAING